MRRAVDGAASSACAPPSHLQQQHDARDLRRLLSALRSLGGEPRAAGGADDVARVRPREHADGRGAQAMVGHEDVHRRPLGFKRLDELSPHRAAALSLRRERRGPAALPRVATAGHAAKRVAAQQKRDGGLALLVAPCCAERGVGLEG